MRKVSAMHYGIKRILETSMLIILSNGHTNLYQRFQNYKQSDEMLGYKEGIQERKIII